jgi:3-isopropylmalate/(R)-2-methylmalate dehydratase small subunit
VKLNVNTGCIEADGKRYDIEPVPEFMQGIVNAGGLVDYAKNLKEVPVCTGSHQ